MLFFQISAILLASILMIGTLYIIFKKTHGKITFSHVVVFLIGFMCLCVAVDWVPAEICLGKNIRIIFTSKVKTERQKAAKAQTEAIIVRSELSRGLGVPTTLGDIKE